MGLVYKTARALGKSLFDKELGKPIGQLIVICGRNKTLSSSLQALEWKIPVKVLCTTCYFNYFLKDSNRFICIAGYSKNNCVVLFSAYMLSPVSSFSFWVIRAWFSTRYLWKKRGKVIPLRKLKLGANTKHLEKWTIVWSWGGKGTLISFSVVLLQIRNCISICMSLWNGTIILALFCCCVNSHIFCRNPGALLNHIRVFFIKIILMAFTSPNATLFLFPN